MQESFKRFMRGFFAVLALVAFVVVVGKFSRDVVDAAGKKPPTYSDITTYIATALAAFVGGVMAVTFGQAPPKLPPPPNPAPPNPNSPPPKPDLVQAATGSLSHLSMTLSMGVSPAEVIGAAYVLVYSLAGVVAVVVWIANPDEASTALKTLGATFLGLFFPIAQGFFSTPTQQ